MKGYHSAQVDVRVRLNTNESPDAPPEGFSAALAERLAGIDWNRYPSRSAGELRSGIADLHGTSQQNVFAAQRVQRGDPDTAAHLRRPGAARGPVLTHLRAARPHRPASSARRWSRRPRRPDFGVGAGAAARFAAAEQPDVLFLCSPNNPTGTVEDPETVQAALEAVAGYGGLLITDEAYVQFAGRGARQVQRGRPAGGGRTAGGLPNLLQGLGAGRRAARLRPGAGTHHRGVAQGWCCRTTST